MAERAYVLALDQLASYLKSARTGLGLSQEHVAHRAGISVFTYASLERGSNNLRSLPNPTLETLLKIFWAFETTVDGLTPGIFEKTSWVRPWLSSALRG
jgi:transcriptional regulator with XRE-family HTH domain